MLDSEYLETLKQDGLYRSHKQISEVDGVRVKVDGRWLINFCSNDYLGMATHPEVINAAQQSAQTMGVGSGSAHLICGHRSAHHLLEKELADFTGRPRALLFSTGYMANLGVIAALSGRGGLVLEDRLNHASLLDGGLLSGARFKRYQHADIADAEVKLTAASGGGLLVTDGVFSMDGDLAPLPKLADLAQKNNALLMVDDAHGLGVIGDQGGGVIEHYGLTVEDAPVLVGTFGKALGTFGAFVAGSETLIETLIQKARTYIYTTALPPAIAEATRTSLTLIQQESWRRLKLHENIGFFKQTANRLGLSLMPSDTAIQPLLIGDNKQLMDVNEAVFGQGFWLGAIRPPTVPQGKARLRITLSTHHQQQQITAMLEALAKLLLIG